MFTLGAAGPLPGRTLARQAARRGKRVSVLPSAAYGGAKDASAAWGAGVLDIEDIAAAGEISAGVTGLMSCWA